MMEYFVVMLVLGISYVFGNACDLYAAKGCYKDLVFYETLSFPLYGNGEAELNDTCKLINTSFDCLEKFLRFCSDETAQCDEECIEFVANAKSFTRTNGLRALEESLCDPKTAIRKTYLENAKCLYQKADVFESCQKYSLDSLEHLTTPKATLEEQCCFFKWHNECLMNYARDHCGESATLLVSFAYKNLVGHIVDQVCVEDQMNCNTPPLPLAEDKEEASPDKTKDNEEASPDKTEDKEEVSPGKADEVKNIEADIDIEDIDYCTAQLYPLVNQFCRSLYKN